MKLIHSADWHLGKRLHGFPLAAEQREALERILDVVDREGPDVVVVAGDVFDTPVPPLPALETWEWFVGQLVGERGVPLVVIPGNHDHPERLGVNASIARLSGLHILNDLATAHVPVNIAGVEIFGLPFHKPAHVRALQAADGPVLAASLDASAGAKAIDQPATDDSGEAHPGAPGSDPGADPAADPAADDDYDAAMRRMLTRIRACRTDGLPAVLVGHAFIDGSGEEPDGEDAILVGGAGGVHPATLTGFDYVALGHIHGARNCDAHGCVRYSGSIYPYSFDDAGRAKTVDVVEVDAGGVTVRQEPIAVSRRVRVIDGKRFAEVIEEAACAPDHARHDYVMVRVTDTGPLDHGLARLREYYPNALLQQPAIRVEAAAVRFDGDARTIGVEDAFRAFYQHVYGQELGGLEEELLHEILAGDAPDEEAAR